MRIERYSEARVRRRRPRRPGGRSGAPAVLVVAIAAVVAAGCDRADPAPTPRDVLLITIDTARADRFSYTGAPGPGTPRIDALAERGAGFVNAISPVPLTLPAHATLLTGRQPPSHTVRDNGTFRLPDAETTLAELLAEEGFATAAFVGAEVLDARYGLDQGFATYDDDIEDAADPAFLYYPERSGEEVVAAASRWLEDRGDEPVFAWVHLFDPHTPYRPPEPERSRHRSAYDGEIAYCDRVVGQLLDHWETSRGLDRTVVIVTSDHGEALGEHDESTHGVLVHDATLRVPLVIAAPGLRVDGAIADPVHLVDVAPTVLALLDLPIPTGVHGRDLGPLLRGGSVAWSPASGYAESLYAQLHHGCAPLYALREHRWKLVHGVGYELYDLETDPGELHDVAPDEPDRSGSMASALEDLVSRLAGGEAEPLALDDDTRRRLGALGYVWSTAPGAAASGAPRDPREALRSMKRMAEADRLALGRDLEGAVAAYRDVLEIEPASVDARVRLAQILLANRRGAEAVDLLVEAVEIAPGEPRLHQKLGFTLETLGEPARGLAAYDAGLALHPEVRALRDGRWRCLARLGRRKELRDEAERAIALDPTDGMARYARAIVCCARDDVDGFIAALERELAELPGDPILENALAGARAEAAAAR